MKKIIITLFLFLGVLFLGTNNVHANDSIDTEIIDNYEVISTEIEYLDDGYLVIETKKEIDDSGIAPLGDFDIINYEKLVTKYDMGDNVQWIYLLHGAWFIEYGVSSECCVAYYETTIENTSWKFSNGEATKVGDTCYGRGTFEYKPLFFAIQTVVIEIDIVCDVYGNIS